MAFSIIQAGDDLKFMNSAGELTTLTLPSAVTLRTDVPPRWLVSGRYVLLVNTPSLPITIDGTGTVRLLAPRAPALGAVLSGVSGGSLSGTYTVKYTFVVVDDDGNLIAESDYSPVSNSVTITTDYLKVANLDISPDEITGRRIYRTTTDGAVYFQWIDLDGNVLTEVQDDLSDAGLSLFASPTLGQPPHLTHIAEFRGRLFGVNSIRPDYVRFTEAGLRYAWPEDNIILIQPEGADTTGITAFASRRDALGVGKLNSLHQIVGSGEISQDIVDLEPVRLTEQCGILSQESVDVYRDTAYFLWYDGVYSWDSSGVRCITDDKVRSWFTTDNEFDRSEFPNAFGKVDPVNLCYRLFLKNPDGESRWIEYDLKSGSWWGPHKTRAFTPVSTFYVADPSETAAIETAVGSEEGIVYTEATDYIDGDNEVIEFRVEGKSHDMQEPDFDKYFGEVSVIQKAQPAGTLDVTATVGELEGDQTSATMEADLTKNRTRLQRVGVGKHASITFENAELDQPVEIYGYEINPVNIVGRR